MSVVTIGIPGWGSAEQAEQLAAEMLVSSNSAKNIEIGTGIKPEDYVGKRLIDVGSGFSDFVACVNQAGGYAVGVDIGYTDLPALIVKGQAYVDESADTAKHIRTTIMTAEILKTLPKDEIERLKKVADDVEGATMAKCLKDMKEHPENYIGESVLSLPFEDGHFQEGFSFSFFTALGNHYDDFGAEAMMEVLRVIERGGTLKIGPNWFRSKDPTESARSKKTEEGVMAAFRAAERAKLATKISRRISESGMIRYDIERSRKR